MIIGLFGFSFEDRNKGCEALTYSFISLLNSIIEEDLTIINLSGIGGTEKVSKRFPNIKFETVGFQKNNISLKSFKCLLKCDAVFDCTFGDNFSDIYSLSFVSRTTNYKELTLLLGKKLVIAPQTIGPFQDLKLRKRVSKVLSKCEMIFTRDELSSECVKELSGREPITVTDLAFLLPFKKEQCEGERIGINVSGLLWEGGFTHNNQFALKVNYHTYIDSIVHECENRGFEIHFIPHVLSSDQMEIDEDYNICSQLAKKYNQKLAPFFEDPIEAKSYISGMDCFIGARMHSTIAAFSSGVVTIPFSYSRKFEGLFNSIGYDYTINAREMETDEAISRTLHYIDHRLTLKEDQIKSMLTVNNLNMTLKDSLTDFLRDL